MSLLVLVASPVLVASHDAPDRAPQTPVEASAWALRDELPPRVYVPRASRSRPSPSAAPTRRRAAAPVKHVVRRAFVAPSGAYAWAHTGDSIAVANCESGDRSAPDVRTRYNGNPHLRGKYSGKWQFSTATWHSVGGTGVAADASESEQDARAYTLFKRDGWGQWECTGIMGVV